MKDNHLLAKGVIYVIIAYILFYLSGYIIHFGLTRILSPSTYGTIGVIITLLSLFQIFLTGIPTSAAKFLAEGIDGHEIRKKSLLLQSSYGIFISILIYFIAPKFSDLLNDKTYVQYIRFLSIIIIIRSIGQLFDSFFNGYGELKKQSFLLIIDGLPKVIFVFIFVYFGYGIFGVLAGYALASLIGILYGALTFKPIKTTKAISYSKIIKFSYPVILFSIFFQIISSLDLFFIKSSNIPEDYVGFYTSARVLSTLLVIVGATFSLTLFPSISKSYSGGDKIKTNIYIKTSLRYIFLIFIPLAVIVSAHSGELLALFFTSQYSIAANSLSILIWAWFFLQSFFVITAMINASGKSIIPAVITASVVIISFFSNHYFVYHYGIDGGAISTLISGIICFGMGIYYVKKIFGFNFDYKSLLKIISASTLIFLLSYQVHFSGILLIAWCILLFSIYLVVLFMIKEINGEDLKLVNELFHHFIKKRLY